MPTFTIQTIRIGGKMKMVVSNCVYVFLTVWIGNLALNQSCSFSEQCARLPYASCLGGNCSCVDGYTAENATSCVQSMLCYFVNYTAILMTMI